MNHLKFGGPREKPSAEDVRSRGWITSLLIAVLLLSLPLAVWLDLTNLAEAALRRQASDLNSVITSVRGYYATNVVGRVLANPGSVQVVHNYEAIPGPFRFRPRCHWNWAK